MQGLSVALSAHCCAWMLPSMSTNTASPGAMSRSNVYPVPSSATDSLATITVFPPSFWPWPMHSGRIPKGSRKASKPWPAISATTAYEPLMRLWTPRTAANTSPGVSGKPRVVFSSSWASTLSSTSESLSVLMWRWSVLNSSAFNAAAFVRLPL